MLHLCYISRHPRSSTGALRRRSERRNGEWRPAAAARNRSLGSSGRRGSACAGTAVHAASIDSGPFEGRRLGDMHLYCRKAAGGNAGEGSADPGRKSPRWSAERRGVPRSGRKAPRKRLGTRRHRVLLRVPLHPSASRRFAPVVREQKGVVITRAKEPPRERRVLCRRRSEGDAAGGSQRGCPGRSAA